MPSLRLRRVARMAISIGVVVLTVEFCQRIPHINQTAIAIALLLALELIAINVGFAEAVVSTVVAGAELVYMFVRVHGWGNGGTVEVVALTTFIATAFITIRLSDQARRGTIEAAKRAEEMAQLYKLRQAFLPAENSSTTIERGLSAAASIFAIEGIAFCLFATGEIFRVGRKGALIPESKLRGSNSVNGAQGSSSAEFEFFAVSGSAGPLGILGFCGARVSREVLQLISQRLAISMEQAAALERATEVEAARRCAELGTTMLDSLAHDMKTPLATIKVSVASLLAIERALPETHQVFLSVIDEEVNRLNSVIGEVLNMGQLESGLLRLQRGPLTVQDLIKSTLEEMGHTLGDRPVGVNIPEGVPRIRADRNLMKQVLKQLVDNAIKYTPEGSPLSISSTQTDGMVTIEVADHGPGIPEEDRQYIFEKYYRGGNGRGGPVGLGLGLAIAKSIVNAHGGQIWMTPNPGSGSIFHLSVPTMESSHP